MDMKAQKNKSHTLLARILVTLHTFILLIEPNFMPSDVVIQRLSFIRYLFTLAVEQSNQPEPLASACMLTFHDSVELNLQLICDKYNIKKNDIPFMQYWEEIKEKSSDYLHFLFSVHF
jgi:hypothetical protein